MKLRKARRLWQRRWSWCWNGRVSRKESDKVVQDQKEQKQGKAVTNQKKDRVLLVGDSLVRHVGRNLEQQCVGLSTVSKPGGRIEQMVPEIEKRGKEDKVFVLCK